MSEPNKITMRRKDRESYLRKVRDCLDIEEIVFGSTEKWITITVRMQLFGRGDTLDNIPIIHLFKSTFKRVKIFPD